MVYSDTVYIGDLTIQNQAVEATTHESYPSNYSSENSGSIGFNADASGLSTSPKQLPMWWQNAKSSLKQQLFAVNFHPTADVGTFDLGFVNTSSYTGTLDYEPLIAGASEWYTTIQGLYSKKYGKTPLAVNITVDTGSNYYGGFSYTLLTAWFGQNIPSATYNDTLETWQFSCSETVPDFSFYFGPNEVSWETPLARHCAISIPPDSPVCRASKPSRPSLWASSAHPTTVRSAVQICTRARNRLATRARSSRKAGSNPCTMSLIGRIVVWG